MRVAERGSSGGELSRGGQLRRERQRRTRVVQVDGGFACACTLAERWHQSRELNGPPLIEALVIRGARAAQEKAEGRRGAKSSAGAPTLAAAGERDPEAPSVAVIGPRSAPPHEYCTLNLSPFEIALR